MPPTKTIKSRRLMGPPQADVHTLSARGASCITAILARYVGSGSWLRENVLAGADTSEHQLTNSGTGKTCHVLAITSWNRLYRLPGRCERSGGGVENMGAPMPSPHARIAAMSGCTPTMFMTRVRL